MKPGKKLLTAAILILLSIFLIAGPATPLKRIAGESAFATTILADTAARTRRFLVRCLSPSDTGESKRSERERRLEDRIVELTNSLEAAVADRTAYEEFYGSAIGPKYDTVPAHVIVARDLNGFPQTVIIDKGRFAGISAGSAVVTGLRVVGRVKEVWLNRALVQLVTDPGFRARARLISSRVLGVYKGGAADRGLFAFAAAGSPVKGGEAVVTSGFERAFPPGLFLGSVISVGDSDFDLELDINVAPAADFSRLENVLVVTGER